MKINKLLTTLFVSTLGLWVDSIEKPNVVFILADDMGYGDVQYCNPERGKVPTPHMNELAGAKMIFTDAHTTSSVRTSTEVRAFCRLGDATVVLMS